MFCNKCGAEIMDEAVICPKCGCYNQNNNSNLNIVANTELKNPVLKGTIKFFLILANFILGLSIIPLCWTIPMTVSYYSKVKSRKPIGIGFKICTILFVGGLAGILMLFDND